MVEMNNIKKRILSGLVIGAFILLPGMKGKASNLKGISGTSKISKQQNLYSDDYLNSRIINNLEINSNINYILEGNNLNLINYNNQLGFINKDNNSNYTYNGKEYNKIDQIGVTTSFVNLRIGPDINEEKIETINKNEIIEILLKSSNGWYLVNYNDTLGFISSEYAKIIDFNSIEEQVSYLPKAYKVVVAKDNVNIRSNPSTESQKLGVLKKDKKLLISNKLNNGWIEVINHKNNKVGYVKSDYVEEEYIISEPYYKQVYMKDDTYLYSYPYSNIIFKLPKYETIFVYGEIDDFYFTLKNNKVGFIRKDDTRELNDKYIVVDISSQNMRVYNNDSTILQSKIVSGKNKTPTNLGIYSIYEKDLNRTLVGDDYQTFVKYWMAFNGGEGFHDASWRNKFGGDIYINNGSHGCVNLPTNIAKKLYDEVSVGTKVLIKK